MLNIFKQRSLSSYSSVLELRDYSKTQKTALSKKEIRALVNIAVIDDEKFPAHSNLTTYGYKIQELPDVTSLEQLEHFDVVLCDLMGVGKNFDQALGGASVIKEIKENYPTKYVIAHTGARANTAEATTAKNYADEFIKKDDEITKLVTKLDAAVEFVIDPYERWLVTRDSLIDLEVDIRRIVEMEDAYVKAIIEHDTEFSSLKTLLQKIDLGGNAKGIVQSLIATGIYTLLLVG